MGTPDTVQQKPVHTRSKNSFLDRKITAREIIFIAALAFCFSSLITPPLALLAGILTAQLIGHPYLHLNHKAVQFLLQAVVVGLGFEMDINSAVDAGKSGLVFTLFSIAGTFILGSMLGKWLSVDRKTSHLISSGTAICGGSAIAAISPVIKAEENQTSTALGVIFILNAAALFIFPPIGHWLGLTQQEFGLWSAIAIHDTSSVIGAASKYGNEALETAAAVKLTRSLWIIPAALISSFLFKRRSGKIKIPYFILLFIAAMAVNTYIPAIRPFTGGIITLSKAGLMLTLFLIGAGLSKKVLKETGFKPLLQGIILWAVISAAGLWAVLSFI